MEIRVFVKDIPKSSSKQEFIDLIKKKTRGTRRILFSSSKESSYALVSYASLDDAMAAIRSDLALRGQRIQVLLYDDPREGQKEAEESISHILGNQILIASEWVNKQDLAYSTGLQLALVNKRRPRWCKYTESNIDCPRGELCHFIHLKKFQATECPVKKGHLGLLQEIDIHRRINLESGKLVYASDEVSLKDISEGSNNGNIPSNLLISPDMPHENAFLRFRFEDSVELLLRDTSEAQRLASIMDKSVEKSIMGSMEGSLESSYTSIFNQIDLNERMNVSLVTLMQEAKKTIAASSVDNSLRKTLSLNLDPLKHRSLIMQTGKTALETEFYACISYTNEEENFLHKVELIYPVHDYLFIEKTAAHSHRIHESISSFLAESVEPILSSIKLKLTMNSGILTLRLGLDEHWETSLLQAYVGGIHANDEFLKKISEENWKRVHRPDTSSVPLVTVIACPPIKVIRSLVPQSWLNLQKRYCEHR